MFPARQGMDVLDVGCGTGLQLAAYQAAGCRCSGIDASPAMLAMARRRLGDRASLHMGGAARTPYPDGAFDLILATTAPRQGVKGCWEELCRNQRCESKNRRPATRHDVGKTVKRGQPTKKDRRQKG